jgi:hypothetical protein
MMATKAAARTNGFIVRSEVRILVVTGTKPDILG